MPLLEEEEVLTEDRGGQGVVEEEGVNSVVAAWVEVPRTYFSRLQLFTMTMDDCTLLQVLCVFPVLFGSQIKSQK